MAGEEHKFPVLLVFTTPARHARKSDAVANDGKDLSVRKFLRIFGAHVERGRDTYFGPSWFGRRRRSRGKIAQWSAKWSRASAIARSVGLSGFAFPFVAGSVANRLNRRATNVSTDEGFARALNPCDATSQVTQEAPATTTATVAKKTILPRLIRPRSSIANAARKGIDPLPVCWHYTPKGVKAH